MNEHHPHRRLVRVEAPGSACGFVGHMTADELKQLVAFLESPVIKKYYAANPQMANLLAQKLVEATRSDVQARIKAFDTRAAQIVGAPGRK